MKNEKSKEIFSEPENWVKDIEKRHLKLKLKEHVLTSNRYSEKFIELLEDDDVTQDEINVLVDGMVEELWNIIDYSKRLDISTKK